MKPSDRSSRGDTKALTIAPLALRAVASEVMLMHQCGLDDGHGRLRAQDHVAEAHEGKEAVGTARLGEGGVEATDDANGQAAQRDRAGGAF